MKKALCIIGACLLSYPIFYYFTIELYYRFYHGNSIFGLLIAITILIGQTILIYTTIDYAVERKISPVNIKILWAIYFIVMAFMLFGRRSIGIVINLDLSEFLNTYYENVALMIMNFIVFIPVGYLLRRYPWTKAAIFALLIVLCIETMQLVTQRGMFDIVDIIIDTAAIIVGYFLSRLVFHKDTIQA
jgi:glycopeptide antibiotics resistance protein